MVLTSVLMLSLMWTSAYATVVPNEELIEGTAARFDLTKGGTQTVETIDKDGNKAIIQATEIPLVRPMDSGLGYGYSTWKISYTTLFSFVEYYIDV